MAGGLPRWRARARRLGIAGLAAAFVALCLAPHWDRLAHPSLYYDDLVRIEVLQQLGDVPLRYYLAIPWQEHLAPMFQAVTWITWRLAGRRLANAPLAF